MQLMLSWLSLCLRWIVVSAADQRKLDMYLPEQLDDVNVVRDLYFDGTRSPGMV
jgi:hypothetical protein